MRIIETEISEVKIIEPRVFGDNRGFFFETWNEQTFANANLNIRFVQDNHSRSSRGTLRGLHYQLIHSQGKLVRVTSGSVFDVAVDVRKSSPTFGHSVSVELSAENHRMLWIPPGFAHGFLVLSEFADFVYKCTELYRPEYERSLLWSDPQLTIAWPLCAGTTPVLALKDAEAKPLSQIDCYP